MSSYTPLQARSQQTLDAILDACDHLLVSRSFEKISMQDIAAEAGISVGNVYNRFKDKEALINYVIASHQQSALESMCTELASVRARVLKTRVERLTEILAKTIQPMRPIFVTLAARQAAQIDSVPPDVLANTDTLVDELTNWLTTQEPGLDHERARFAVASIAFGLQYNLIFQTPTRLFGDRYLAALSQQACAYLNSAE